MECRVSLHNNGAKLGGSLRRINAPRIQEVQYLLQVVAIEALCRRANVERIEAGPKGAELSLRDNVFANPEGLIGYIGKHPEGARVRPDMKVVFFDEWDTPPSGSKAPPEFCGRWSGLRRRRKAA